jgi:hypothetical protein
LCQYEHVQPGSFLVFSQRITAVDHHIHSDELANACRVMAGSIHVGRCQQAGNRTMAKEFMRIGPKSNTPPLHSQLQNIFCIRLSGSKHGDVSFLFEYRQA